MMKYMRPGTTNLSRSNILIRRKSHSKEMPKMRLGDFLNTKSNSPVKRRELYEDPSVKKEKPTIHLKISQEKKEVQPKLFEPIDIVPLGQNKKRHQSMGRIVYEKEKIVSSPERGNIKVVINKNHEIK